jgi:PncC family amidohydrolase
MREVSMNSEALEVTVGKLLTQRGLTLALAESCTGGLVSHRLTEVPGSSVYFRGAVVAYANEAKQQLLGVRQDTLDAHGAVSAEAALEMAQGARRALGTDVGLSVTGIAGPGGAMPGKPVGLVFVALAAQDDERCERHVWEDDRSGNKALSAQAALVLLCQYLDSLPSPR